MKFTLYAVCIALTLALAAASDAGYFLPRAYYTIDSEGHVSNLQPIAPQVLRRLRRQTGSAAFSSSSSSSNGNGAFTSHHVETHGPGGVHFDSRFSDDSASGSYSSGPSFGSHPADAYGSGIGSGLVSGIGSGLSGIGVGVGSGLGYGSHSGDAYASGSGTGSGTGRTDTGAYRSRDEDSRPIFGSRYVGASSSGSISSGGPNFESRFGGVSSTFSSEDGRTSGRTVHTTGYIDKDGRVHQKTSESHI